MNFNNIMFSVRLACIILLFSFTVNTRAESKSKEIENSIPPEKCLKDDDGLVNCCLDDKIIEACLAAHAREMSKAFNFQVTNGKEKENPFLVKSYNCAMTGCREGFEDLCSKALLDAEWIKDDSLPFEETSSKLKEMCMKDGLACETLKDHYLKQNDSGLAAFYGQKSKKLKSKKKP